MVRLISRGAGGSVAGQAGLLPSVVDHHVIVRARQPWAYGIDHPSDTNQFPTAFAKIDYGERRLCFRRVPELEP